MLHAGADVFFALEAVVHDRVALHLRMRDLDGNGGAGVEIGGLEDGGHAAGRDDALDAEVVELVAGMDVEVSEHWNGFPAGVAVINADSVRE